MAEESETKLEEMAGGKGERVFMGGGGRAGGGLLLGKGTKRERLGCATTAKERISKMPPCVAGKRSSIYRGVTRHRWTGRYEAHLWDKGTWNQNQNKKGKQVYLGAYDDEEAAARAYDLAALKYWGAGTLINFPVSDYSRDLEEMQNVSKEEYLVSLRRKSSAFSRGFPKSRGISRNVQTGRLETSLGQMLCSEYCNSITFSGDTESIVKSYASGFCTERKIDLTGYIRWWISKRVQHPDSLPKSHDNKYGDSEDFIHELRVLECTKKATEPYQFPSLGLLHQVKSRAPISASTFLARSAAFKNFQQKIKEMHCQDGACCKENDNMNYIPICSNSDEVEKVSTSLPADDLPIQRTYSKFPVLSMPLKTNWNSMDPVSDPIFWENLLPATSLSLSATILKQETSHGYHCEE